MNRAVRELTRRLERDEPCAICNGKGDVGRYPPFTKMHMDGKVPWEPEGEYTCGACRGSGLARPAADSPT